RVHAVELSGMQYAVQSKPAYALHQIRNLRNHIAHGVFPLIPNPDYDWGIDRVDIVQLLNQSCRLSAMYVQMLIYKFNTGFRSDEYNYCENSAFENPEYESFL